MATIAIEDDRDEKKMNVHALLTPLITTRKDEKKGDEEVTALDRYALLRGAPRERPGDLRGFLEGRDVRRAKRGRGASDSVV